jgi:hypothetical protein
MISTSITHTISYFYYAILLIEVQYVYNSSYLINKNLARTFDTFLLGDSISFISLSFFIFLVFTFYRQILKIAYIKFGSSRMFLGISYKNQMWF